MFKVVGTPCIAKTETIKFHFLLVFLEMAKTSDYWATF
jgi:hypothetical protein